MAIGSPRWQSRRAFTQYFLDNPEKTKEYSDVKIRSMQLANELKNTFPLPKTVEEYTEQRDKQFNEYIKNKEGYINGVYRKIGFVHSQYKDLYSLPESKKIWTTHTIKYTCYLPNSHIYQTHLKVKT